MINKDSMEKKIKNKRKYIRIHTVVPVEFFVCDNKGEKITPWIQGFTRDIGDGGICLLINDLWEGFVCRFQNKDALFFLYINLPFQKNPLIFKAKLVWFTIEKLNEFSQYRLGMELIEVDTKKNKKLFKFAVFGKLIPYLMSISIGLLIIFSGFWVWRSEGLIKENRLLGNNYVRILEKQSVLNQILEEEKSKSLFLKNRQAALEIEMRNIRNVLSDWKKNNVGIRKDNLNKNNVELLEVRPVTHDKFRSMEFELEKLKKENNFLKKKEVENKAAVSIIQQKVKILNKEKREFSCKIIEGMYDWIKNRQDLNRGLVLSYEGDENLRKTCFTYDQALAVLTFMIFKDTDKAEKILSFYVNKINKGEAIYNAYFTSGQAFEYVVHSGPNAWLGMAAISYVRKTGDKEYLIVADKVSKLLLTLMDKEGGVVGGPNDAWYSTEHNLDAYSFFYQYYRLTGEKKYLRSAEKIKNWISRYSYTSSEPPIKRGKGDSTIATDTYTWSITAFGLKELYSLKMDPEEILKYAVKNCEISTMFRRVDGNLRVKGFDFAKSKNIARGGIISGEWTSQMILAFEIMSDYFKGRDIQKSKEYMQKAMFYFNELQKMLITSPSRVGREDLCLPYSSCPSADTGHGWRTPKGNRTGSLASTAYCLFAYYGYNPLKDDYLEVSLKNKYDNM